MRDRRDANRKRIKKGIDDGKKPRSIEFVPQGSYAMKTMVQDPDNHYDIDDGIYFDKTVLLGLVLEKCPRWTLDRWCAMPWTTVASRQSLKYFPIVSEFTMTRVTAWTFLCIAVSSRKASLERKPSMSWLAQTGSGRMRGMSLLGLRKKTRKRAQTKITGASYDGSAVCLKSLRIVAPVGANA